MIFWDTYQLYQINLGNNSFNSMYSTRNQQFFTKFKIDYYIYSFGNSCLSYTLQWRNFFEEFVFLSAWNYGFEDNQSVCSFNFYILVRFHDSRFSFILWFHSLWVRLQWLALKLISNFLYSWQIKIFLKLDMVPTNWCKG